MTPTTRTIRLLERRGFLADVVERQTGPIKRDLYGFIDVLAIHPRSGTWAIQVTTRSNKASRIRKVKQHPSLPYVLAQGWQVYVWWWWKDPKAGWVHDERQITG